MIIKTIFFIILGIVGELGTIAGSFYIMINGMINSMLEIAKKGYKYKKNELDEYLNNNNKEKANGFEITLGLVLFLIPGVNLLNAVIESHKMKTIILNDPTIKKFLIPMTDKEIFNTETEKGWIVNPEKIPFADHGYKTWKHYVDIKRLEITCGEAPYLVSRYDTVTGVLIPVKDRIGLLDRKMRAVLENTQDEDDWFNWAVRAYQSIYGYEYQGDNLLLARENLLVSFIDYHQDRFGTNPTMKQILRIANIISWNIWQMDGMKYVVPNSCSESTIEEFTLWGSEIKKIPCPGCEKNLIQKHNGIYCKVFDWRRQRSLPFVSMMKGVSA